MLCASTMSLNFWRLGSTCANLFANNGYYFLLHEIYLCILLYVCSIPHFPNFRHTHNPRCILTYRIENLLGKSKTINIFEYICTYQYYNIIWIWKRNFNSSELHHCTYMWNSRNSTPNFFSRVCDRVYVSVCMRKWKYSYILSIEKVYFSQVVLIEFCARHIIVFKHFCVRLVPLLSQFSFVAPKKKKRKTTKW